MRALLLNDTRSEHHLGCDLVVKNLLQGCQQTGIDVVATVPNASFDDAQIVRNRAADYDLLLINGEGTMHHDQPKGLSLGRAASAAAELGKPVVLLNTVWQGNRQLNDFLPSIRRVYCRESLSQAELATAGCEAVVVPDLIFATNVPVRAGKTTDGTVVLDSVDRRVTMHWAWQAARQGYTFMSMHLATCQRLRRRLLLSLCLKVRSGSTVKLLGATFASDLAGYSRVISGRFHGACLAFVLGIPVVGIRSNTFKSEGMFRDAGLDDRALVATGGRAELQRAFAYVDGQRAAVANYVASARTRIAQMFQEIRSLL